MSSVSSPRHMFNFRVENYTREAVDQKATEFYAGFEKRLNEISLYVPQVETFVDDVQGRIKAIPPSKWYVKIGRLCRSVGLVALYILGIVTVIPVVVAGVAQLRAEAKANDVTRIKVFQIVHKYITLKSQEQVDLEDQLEKVTYHVLRLHNPISWDAVISDGRHSTVVSGIDLPRYVNNSQGRVDEALALEVRIDALYGKLGL